ncbi:hypothetical protein TEA_028913 [Camellia sinensis var. sinensis]|uniref:Fe2OG dioxygenase domain-containing protein n=1 Tax=Camellia sinensis var. sinensis TaxID=542762 RepID=A0A4S4ETP4_CAMSN|nr:hypothetical protein TEA_028913 [Camellia sinensis var. sinensis]
MKRKMGERKKGQENGKKTKLEWPPIKPKFNLNITRLKDTDLFTGFLLGVNETQVESNGYAFWMCFELHCESLAPLLPGSSRLAWDLYRCKGCASPRLAPRHAFHNTGPRHYWTLTQYGYAYPYGYTCTAISVAYPKGQDVTLLSYLICYSFVLNKISGTELPIVDDNGLKCNNSSFVQDFQVRNLFTSVESKAFIKAAELIGFVHQGSLGPTKGEAYRDNDRISMNDPVLANTIWESGLNKLCSDFKIRGKVAVGLNPNIRIYRYKVGQRFGRHVDESVDLGEGKRTHYTLLIYLSGGFKPKPKNDNSDPQDSSEPLIGGETVFYGPRNGVVAEVSPTEGMALLHIHGDKCMLHEARNVTKGVKYVLRSDVAFA